MSPSKGLASLDKERSSSKARGNKGFAEYKQKKLEREGEAASQQLFSRGESEGAVAMKVGERSPAVEANLPSTIDAPAREEAVEDEVATEDDIIKEDKVITDDEAILGATTPGALTPIGDDLLDVEDFKIDDFKPKPVEKMILSPPGSPEKEVFKKPSDDSTRAPRSSLPAGSDDALQLLVVKPNHQRRPQWGQLIEPPLSEPWVWVHCKARKLPVLEWRRELSQLSVEEVKEFQAWCIWASNWKKLHGHWEPVPFLDAMQLEQYGIRGPEAKLTRLMIVLSLSLQQMSLLRVLLQAQTLVRHGEQRLGGGVVASAVQWAVATLGPSELQFKATAIFGCVPEREESPGLDSTVVTDFETSALGSDMISAGDLYQSGK